MRIWILETIQETNKKIGYVKFRKRFQDMFGILNTSRAKKKLKSTRHYLVNDDEKQARHFYKQLEKELK